MKRFFYCLALAMAVTACASFGKFTKEAQTVVDGLWNAAKLLCLVAHAEKAGGTIDDVAGKCCERQDEIEPWLDAARAGARAGAVKVGMTEPLTPANASPSEIKPVPELEPRK